MLSFLPQALRNAILKLNYGELYEIRIRSGYPIRAYAKGGSFYLCEGGYGSQAEAIVLSGREIEEILLRACERSVYAVSERLKQGFLTAKGGIRIGIAGEYAVENGKISSLQKVHSLNIRFPHEAIGCAEVFYNRALRGGRASVLISSPPAYGKTTFVRDLVRLLLKSGREEILIADERGEITLDGSVDCCRSADVMLYTPKEFAFTVGVRCMNPTYIVTDELQSAAEAALLHKAWLCGVNVIATCHFSSLNAVLTHETTATAAQNGVFDYFVFLRKNEGEIVYSKEGGRLYG